MTSLRASKGNSYILSLRLLAILIALFFAAPATPVKADPPNQPSLTSPAEGDQLSNSGSLEFSWDEASQTATWFYIWISRNGSKYFDQWVGGSNSWNPPQDFAGGNYTWWVRPWGPGGYGPWSGAGNFSIATNTPGQVALWAPLDSTETNSTQQYTWKAEPSASWYEVYVSCNNSCFSDKWYASSNLTSVTDGGLAVAIPGHRKGNYRWWVRGWGIDGMGAWSGAGAFTMSGSGPGVLAQISPRGTIFSGTNLNYVWTFDTNATWYELCATLENKILFDKWIALSNLTDMGFGQCASEEGDHSAGNYQWWVRGWGPDGMGPWSPAASFSISNAPAPLPVEQSRWTGSVRSSAGSCAQVRNISSLVFVDAGSFIGTGNFQSVTNEPYSISQNREAYSGTYTLEQNTLSGTSEDGTTAFTFLLDPTFTQILSGTWTDAMRRETFAIRPSQLLRIPAPPPKEP